MYLPTMRTIFLLAMCLVLAKAGITQSTTYIHCGRLFDATSTSVKTQQTIIIEGERIKEVRTGYADVPTDAKAVDLKDHFVMPGLMDMHVHIEHESTPRSYEERFRKNPEDLAFDAAVYAKTTLMAGFTTVRDLGGTGVNVAIRKAIDAGKVPGPRIFTAEKSIATTGGHADPTNGSSRVLMGDPGPKEGVVNSADEAAKAVRQRYKNGADCIKITATGGVLSVAKDGQGPQFNDEELAAIITTAKDYGMITAAHAHGKDGMLRAVKAGITSIEHGSYADDEVMDEMVKRGTYLVPTISAGAFVAEKAAVRDYFPAIVVPKALAIGPQMQDMTRRAYAKGVKIAFGTDAGVQPHGTNAREFSLMHKAGIPTAEAIVMATRIPAEMLDVREDLGTIEAGRYADIVAVKADPLTDISTLENIQFVMKSGKVYKSGGNEQVVK